MIISDTLSFFHNTFVTNYDHHHPAMETHPRASAMIPATLYPTLSLIASMP